MDPDQTTVAVSVEEPLSSSAFVALDRIHTQLRHAVEDRNYSRVQDLVAQQRAVFEKAGPQHAEALQHAQAGRELASWALTMVRLQRAHTQRALLELAGFKRAHESYRPKHVRPYDCHVEG